MRVQFEKYVQTIKTLLGWANLTSAKREDGTLAYLGGPFGNEDRKGTLILSIQEMAALLRNINLTVSARRADVFAEAMGSPRFEWEGFRQHAIEVYNTLRCECEEKLFIFVPPEKAKFYERSNPFGERVGSAFPNVAYDLREAGDCLALGRNTACVFHLMRVLERGLAAMAIKFGLEWEHRNWQQVIQDIEAELRNRSKAPKTTAERADLEFYSQTAAHFLIFKDAYRNFTAHARGRFDEHEATRLFENIHVFMEKLAIKGLSEP